MHSGQWEYYQLRRGRKHSAQRLYRLKAAALASSQLSHGSNIIAAHVRAIASAKPGARARVRAKLAAITLILGLASRLTTGSNRNLRPTFLSLLPSAEFGLPSYICSKTEPMCRPAAPTGDFLSNITFSSHPLRSTWARTSRKRRLTKTTSPFDEIDQLKGNLGLLVSVITKSLVHRMTDRLLTGPPTQNKMIINIFPKILSITLSGSRRLPCVPESANHDPAGRNPKLHTIPGQNAYRALFPCSTFISGWVVGDL